MNSTLTLFGDCVCYVNFISKWVFTSRFTSWKIWWRNKIECENRHWTHEALKIPNEISIQINFISKPVIWNLFVPIQIYLQKFVTYKLQSHAFRFSVCVMRSEKYSCGNTQNIFCWCCYRVKCSLLYPICDMRVNDADNELKTITRAFTFVLFSLDLFELSGSRSVTIQQWKKKW